MKQRTTAEGKALVSAFYESGLTQREFAAQKGVTQCSLQYWRQRVKHLKDIKDKGNENRFIEIAVPQGGVGAIRITLGQLEIFFPTLPPTDWLYEFVSSLSNRK